MTLIAQLQSSVSFGEDAIGTEIITDEIAIKWMTLDFTNGSALCECTLPMRPDVSFARSVEIAESNISTAEIATALAAQVESELAPPFV